MAMTFLRAPPTSVPITSLDVYTRRRGERKICSNDSVTRLLIWNHSHKPAALHSTSQGLQQQLQLPVCSTHVRQTRFKGKFVLFPQLLECFPPAPLQRRDPKETPYVDFSADNLSNTASHLYGGWYPYLQCIGNELAHVLLEMSGFATNEGTEKATHPASGMKLSKSQPTRKSLNFHNT